MNEEIQTVCLALIHNSDEQRNAYIQPLLKQLQTVLLQRCSAVNVEVSCQPEIKQHTLRTAFLRDAIYQTLDRQWCRYRRIRPQRSLSQASRFLRESIKKLFRTDNSWLRNSAVEVIVTDKHIRAWSTFLETGADFLICFEDDAVFKEQSVVRITELLNTLFQGNIDKRIYIDLAGGCTLEQLRIDNLENGRDASFRLYRKPVTNTACVYLMSRPLVSLFYEIITRKPLLRLIGIDWMMNKLFIELADQGLDCGCMHADPTIFDHGTTTGEYVSWQASRLH
jgi:hypothetical protein